MLKKLETDFEPLTHQRLTNLFNYDPKTGLLTWRYNRSYMAHKGDEAGTINANGMVMVGVDGRIYSAARLVWFITYGTWPPSRLHYRDENPQNLRLSNLTVTNPRYSGTKTARLQRRWRNETKEIEAVINANPQLLEEYLTASAIRARRIRSEVRDKLRDQQMHPSHVDAHR